jgi:serine/threonine protein kinase
MLYNEASRVSATLFFFTFTDESCGLDWHTRYKIIKGICEGLNYLHNGSQDNRMYHLDLKPENILLDDNMMPKIADFGLSRLFGGTQTHITTNFQGTMSVCYIIRNQAILYLFIKTCNSSSYCSGYIPPEYINKREISKKYDVFSLGVIIIEIMAGSEGRSKSAEMSSEQFVELVKRLSVSPCEQVIYYITLHLCYILLHSWANLEGT